MIQIFPIRLWVEEKGILRVLFEDTFQIINLFECKIVNIFLSIS